MEKSGGLSPVLKQRIAGTKVAIVGSVAIELIADAIRRLGFVDIVSVPDSTDLPICDVVICTCAEKADCRAVITHYNDVSVICAYNFASLPRPTLSDRPPSYVPEAAPEDG